MEDKPPQDETLDSMQILVSKPEHSPPQHLVLSG